MKKVLALIVIFGVAGFLAFGKYRNAKKEVDGLGEKRELHLYAMSDYMPAEVIKGFEETHNAKVHYDNFSSNEELLAKLQGGTGGYDVIIASDYVVKALIEGGLIQELTRDKISNYSQLAAEFKDVPYDPGEKFTVPYTWGTTGLIYNTKFVKKNTGSWSMLFDKENSKRVALLDDQREVLGAMLYKLGYSVNTLSESELRQAQKLLMELKSNIRVFSSDPKQHLLNGDVWVAQAYSGDANQVIRANPDFKYTTPSEGSVIWIDNMAIPAKAPQRDLAHAFINYILDSAVSASITQSLQYSSPHSVVEHAKVGDELKPSYIKKLTAKKLEFLRDLGSKTLLWDQIWMEARSN